MMPLPRYAEFRPMISSDLEYFAKCMGAESGLPYPIWRRILDSLQLQYQYAENEWSPHASVYAIQGAPVFLLEEVGDQLQLTVPPTWRTSVRRMALAWQASFLYMFLQRNCSEVRVQVPEARVEEIMALENLGCRRIAVEGGRTGSYVHYGCGAQDLYPVV